ncbi:suppressor of loss of ypt1 [Chytridiales sp. JEL 0842]|nr:suppressor of loss of ypt1 [Chytridiales sp. JEL 0842]
MGDSSTSLVSAVPLGLPTSSHTPASSAPVDIQPFVFTHKRTNTETELYNNSKSFAPGMPKMGINAGSLTDTSTGTHVKVAVAAQRETSVIEWIKFSALCVLWYSSSAITNNIGKQLLNVFWFPVTLTYAQFGFVSVLSMSVSYFRLGFGKIRVPSLEVIRTTAPLSGFLIMGHVFSSMAISRVPVSFVHTIKALSPLFTVIIYRAYYSIRYSPKVYKALLPLTLGVMLVCTSKVSFHIIGFICALGSTVIFVLQNILSKNIFIAHSVKSHNNDHKKLDKLNVLFYSSSLAFIMMFPMWFFADGLTLLDIWTTDPYSPSVSSKNPSAPSPSAHQIASAYLIPSGKHAGKPRISAATHRILFLFLINGLTHFSQAVLAFWILAQVSPITYSIASLLKRIFVIIAAIIYFGDELTVLQMVGIGLTFVGLWMYDQAKSSVAHGEAELVALSERSTDKKGLPMSVRH